MPKGTFRLERYNGVEEFTVSAAELCAFGGDEGLQLIFTVHTAGPALQSLPDTAEFEAEPMAEFCINVDQVNWDSLVGQRYEIPESYIEEVGEHMTRIHYCEDGDVDECIIQITGRNENQEFKVVIEGTCVDVNHYDDSSPRTKVIIDAWFTPEEKTPEM